MKKIIAITLFTVFFLLGGMQEAKAEQVIQSGDWRYFVENGSAVLFKYAGTEENVSIPSVIDGYTVKKLRYYILNGTNVKTITIPSTVEDINSLSLTVGVDKDHYMQTGYLEAIYVDQNNKKYASVDGVLFSKDKKTLLTYPEGRTAESYSIPSGVEIINTQAFRNNRNIKQITFSKSVILIENYAFFFLLGFAQHSVK